MSCRIRRILQFREAIVYQDIKVYDANNIDITNNCMYSWSSDGVCWTNWVTYKGYTDIVSNYDSDFYLRVLLFGSFDRISLGGLFSNCYNICLDSSNEFLQDFCGSTTLFQPYNNLDCALLLQQQLADSIICMLGIPIYYFQTAPREETVDYTFKEFALHDVVAVKQLKLMIPDGQMPSSNPKLTDFDFDWQVDWETELSKTQFAKAFGDTEFPKSNDFIYIPMMKRMWAVNAAYDEKNEGLLWRSTTWKLTLVKYNDSTNVITDGFDNIIDNWIVNTYEDTFGKLEKIEQEREVGASPLTAPSFAATNLFDIFMEDAVRKQYTKEDIGILDKIYCHRNNVVARNLYKFKNDNGCVTYQKGICGESGTIMFILETGGTLGDTLDKDIMNFGPIDIQLAYLEDKEKFIIGCHELYTEIDPFSTYMVIYKWNRDNVSTELLVYKYSYDQSIPKYKLRPESYYFDFENPICELVGRYDNDYIINEPMECQIHPYPAQVTNVKLYNRCLGFEESIKESIKYVTQDDRCIINDLARPINAGHGYVVR